MYVLVKYLWNICKIIGVNLNFTFVIPDLWYFVLIEQEAAGSNSSFNINSNSEWRGCIALRPLQDDIQEWFCFAEQILCRAEQIFCRAEQILCRESQLLQESPLAFYQEDPVSACACA